MALPTVKKKVLEILTTPFHLSHDFLWFMTASSVWLAANICHRFGRTWLLCSTKFCLLAQQTHHSSGRGEGEVLGKGLAPTSEEHHELPLNRSYNCSFANVRSMQNFPSPGNAYIQVIIMPHIHTNTHTHVQCLTKGLLKLTGSWRGMVSMRLRMTWRTSSRYFRTSGTVGHW